MQTVSDNNGGAVQEFVQCYLRLSAKKKKRVDRLWELLRESDDRDEQMEIAGAIEEICTPELRQRHGTADPQEGVPPTAIAKVEAYHRHVGEMIRRRRKELGMTQEQLAEKSGLPQSHISRLESGQHAPADFTIEKLAFALDTEPSQLDVLYYGQQ